MDSRNEELKAFYLRCPRCNQIRVIYYVIDKGIKAVLKVYCPKCHSKQSLSIPRSIFLNSLGEISKQIFRCATCGRFIQDSSVVKYSGKWVVLEISCPLHKGIILPQRYIAQELYPRLLSEPVPLESISELFDQKAETSKIYNERIKRPSSRKPPSTEFLKETEVKEEVELVDEDMKRVVTILDDIKRSKTIRGREKEIDKPDSGLDTPEAKIFTPMDSSESFEGQITDHTTRSRPSESRTTASKTPSSPSKRPNVPSTRPPPTPPRRVGENEEKKEKVERILIDILIFVLIPLIIGVLFYVLLPIEKENLLTRGLIAGTLAFAISGVLMTIRDRFRLGAICINGGIIGFVVQYIILVTSTITDAKLITVFWFLAILISTIPFLINIHWLGRKEKIAGELFTKLSKIGAVILLSDFLILIVYSSYFWWFENLVSSLGLGLMVFGVTLPIFRYFIESRENLYLLSMLPINLGIAFMIFGGLFTITLDMYYSFFFTCIIGFSINLTINLIFWKKVGIFSNDFWNRLIFVDFLGIAIFGSFLFFGLMGLGTLYQSTLGLLWLTAFTFAWSYFAFQGDLISVEVREKVWLIAGFAIAFEISMLISVAIYYAFNLLLAVGSFIASSGVLMLLFNGILNKKYLYYINSINIISGFGIIIGESIYLQFLNVYYTIFWAIFAVNCMGIGIFLFGWGRKFLTDKTLFRLLFLEFLSIAIFGSFLFFGLKELGSLYQSALGLLWLTAFTFGGSHFAFRGDVISVEVREKLWLVAGFGIAFEVSMLISVAVYYAFNLRLAVGSFIASSGVLMLLFNGILNKKFLYYINSINIMSGFGIIIGESIYLQSLNVYYTIFWAIFAVNCIGIGMFLFGWGRKFLTDKTLFRVLFLEFLSITIFGSFLVFGLMGLGTLYQSTLGLLWITAFTFAWSYFAFRGDLISIEIRDRFWLVAGFGIAFEVSMLISVAVYYTSTLLLAVGSFIASSGVLMILFNGILNKKYLYYINSINIMSGFGIITGEFIYSQSSNLYYTVFWAIFVINCITLGTLLYGWGRKFLTKIRFCKLNLFNWIILSIAIGLFVGEITEIAKDIAFPFWLGLLIGSLTLVPSLSWAEGAGYIGNEWINRLYRIFGVAINLQLANIFSLAMLYYPNGPLGYTAIFLIIFSLATFFLLKNIGEKRLFLLNHIFLSLGVFLLLAWSALIENIMINLIFAGWIALMMFSIIIPIAFEMEILLEKNLFRLSIITYLSYIIFSIFLINYIIPVDFVLRNYFLIIVISIMLHPATYLGKRGELISERIYYGLESLVLSIFIVTFSLFMGTLLGIDLFYRMTFILLIFFILLVPDLYLLKRAGFLRDNIYKVLIQFTGNILSAIIACIFAGIPIAISNNWSLALGIFFLVFALLSGLIELYYKRYRLFTIFMGIFFGGFFWFLYNILISWTIIIQITVFWVLFVDFILILFFLDICKQYGLVPTRPARIGIAYMGFSLITVIAFIIEWYLLIFPLLAIITSILFFLLFSRIIVNYIISNDLFPESGQIFILIFSKWSTILTNSIFFYVLLNTLIPMALTFQFQIFNISFSIALFLLVGCIVSEVFRNKFIKIITNRGVLTGFSAFCGIIIAILLYIYFENLFFGISLGLLIILTSWKAIHSNKFFSKYLLIGVPIILGVMIYKLISDFIATNMYYINFFDNLYSIFQSIGSTAIIFFFLSITFWRFKSSLKYSFLIGGLVFIQLALSYNIYFEYTLPILSFTQYFTAILPWLISVLLMSSLGFTYFFKRQSWIFLSISLTGLFMLCGLLAFNFLFPSGDVSMRVISSVFASGGFSFFILSICAKYFDLLISKFIALTLGVAVISGSITLGIALYLFQGINPLISSGLAIDFGIFLYYLALVCYFWELSKKIWEKGWFAWIAIPVVNALLIFLSMYPMGMEYIIFGVFLAIAIGHILFLPVIYYRWRSNFRLSWFIIWAEIIPLSFSVAFYFWFQEFFASAIFSLGFITILLAVIIYFIKMWRLSAILWLGLSIGNGVIFFISGFTVIESIIALLGISLLIVGLQAVLLTIFPNIPKKVGPYLWVLISGGITVLAVNFGQLSLFASDTILTIFFAGLVCLLSLYPLKLFITEKKRLYKIIGYGVCAILPLFIGFLLNNTLVLAVVDDLERVWISTSIGSIILGFILLGMHRLDVLKRAYWVISWMIVSASISALFGWFGFYVIQIQDNLVNLFLCLLIFEIILVPSSRKFWKPLGEVLIGTFAILLGFLVDLYFGIAIFLILSAIFLHFWRLPEKLWKMTQELILSSGIFFFLFWGLQIVLPIWTAFLIAGYIVLFYPFIRTIQKKQWLGATLFWLGLIVIPAAVGVWYLLGVYVLVPTFHCNFLCLSTAFSLGLALPIFKKVPKKISSIIWIALGVSLSLILYDPILSLVKVQFPTFILLSMFITLFIVALPLFNLPAKISLYAILSLSVETTLLMFNYIYIGTAGDWALTSLYAVLIEGTILFIYTLWRKTWSYSMFCWYLISISLGSLYIYYRFLILGVLSPIDFMIGILLIGVLMVFPIGSSKLSINQRFVSYLLFTLLFTISITYFSSFVFIGALNSIFMTSVVMFLPSSFLLIFYRGFESSLDAESILYRFYLSSFWILLSLMNISASILVFWVLYIGISLTLEFSILMSITLGYSLFLISKKFRERAEHILAHLYTILPVFIGGIIYSGISLLFPKLDVFLILYFSFLGAFVLYWILYDAKAIKWRIHEILWAISPIPLVLWVGNSAIIHLADVPLAISSGILIYASLLVFIFIFTFENKSYLNLLWVILTISLSSTIFFGSLQIAKAVPYLIENLYLSFFLSLTIGFGIALIWLLWQHYKFLGRFVYIWVISASSFTIYFTLLDYSAFTITNAILLSLFIWVNFLGLFAVFPEIDWRDYKYVWIIISSILSTIGGYLVGYSIYIQYLSFIPAIMIGSIIFSLLWIKPPLAPTDLNFQKYILTTTVISANISLGWLLMIPLALDVFTGILIPLLIGDLLLLVLALKNYIEKKYWKLIYVLIPLIGLILGLIIFNTYNLLDIYLNIFIPILIGVVLIFPLVIEYSPLRFLTRNSRILVICIAGISAIVTFLGVGYIPFLRPQTLLKGLISAVVVIVIIYSILPKAFELTEFTYLYISVALAAGFSIVYLLFVPEAEFWKKIIAIMILSAGAACLGSYKIMAKKAEGNPELGIWRTILLVGGFIAIVVLTILMFAFHVVT